MTQNSLGYTNLTYQEIRDRVDELLKAGDYKNFSQSAIYKIFLDILSAQFDMVNYYIERRAEETYLDTAKLKSSLIALSRMLGYDITRPRPASVEVSIFIKNPNYGSTTNSIVGKTISIPKYTKLIGPNNLPFFLADNVTYYFQEDKREYEIRFKSLDTVFLEGTFFQERKVKPIFAVQGIFKDVQFKATDYPSLINAPFARIELNDPEFSDIYGENDEGYSLNDIMYYTSIIPSVPTSSGTITGYPDGMSGTSGIPVENIFSYENGYSFLVNVGDMQSFTQSFKVGLTANPNVISVSADGYSIGKYVIPKIYHYPLNTTNTKKFKNLTRLVKYNYDLTDDTDLDSIFYYDVRSTDRKEYAINRSFVSDPNLIKNPYYSPVKVEDDVPASCQIKTTEKGGVELIFGDDIVSQKAFRDAKDILYLRYFATQGTKGNFSSFIDNKFVLIDKDAVKWYNTAGTLTDSAGTVNIIIKSAAIGGSDLESNDSIRVKASSNFSSKGRLVSRKDYREFLLNSVINEYGRSARNVAVWSEQDEIKESKTIADKRFANTILFSLIGSLYYIDSDGKYIAPLQYSLNDENIYGTSVDYSTTGEENCVIDGKAWYDFSNRFFELFDIYTTVNPSDDSISKYNGVHSAIYETKENAETTGKFLNKIYNILTERSMITTKHCYISPLIHDISVEGAIFIERLADKSKIESEIKHAIYSWADSNIDFKTNVLRADIVSLLSNIPGIKYIDDISFKGLDRRTHLTKLNTIMNVAKIENGKLIGFNFDIDNNYNEQIINCDFGSLESLTYHKLLKSGIFLEALKDPVTYKKIFAAPDNTTSLTGRYEHILSSNLGTSFYEKIPNLTNDNEFIVNVLNGLIDNVSYQLAQNLIDENGNITKYSCSNEIVKLISNVKVIQI